jgi:hypothetical protein
MFRRIIFLAWLLLTGLAKAELVANSTILPRLVSANDAIIAEARPQPGRLRAGSPAQRGGAHPGLCVRLRGTRVALLS